MKKLFLFLCVLFYCFPSFALVAGTGIKVDTVTANVGKITAITATSVTASIISTTTVNATSTLKLNGTDINTTGTLSNVAYKGQNNSFSVAQTIASQVTIGSMGAMIRTGYWAISDFPNTSWTTVMTINDGGYFCGNVSIATSFSGDYNGCHLYRLVVAETGTATLTDLGNSGVYGANVELRMSGMNLQGYRTVYGPIIITVIGAGGQISFSNGM